MGGKTTWDLGVTDYSTSEYCIHLPEPVVITLGKRGRGETGKDKAMTTRKRRTGVGGGGRGTGKGLGKGGLRTGPRNATGPRSKNGTCVKRRK